MKIKKRRRARLLRHKSGRARGRAIRTGKRGAKLRNSRKLRRLGRNRRTRRLQRLRRRRVLSAQTGAGQRADASPPQAPNVMKQVEMLQYRPMFSVLLPVYNLDERSLGRSIESVLRQQYPSWELCIADDASTEPHVKKVLSHVQKLDSRVKVVYRKERGNIAAAANSALQLAAGEYIAVMNQGDELAPDALYENALLLNSRPQADMIYSDEDRVDEDRRLHSAYYKPDWSPDLLMGQMYTCNLGVYRTRLVRDIGGFREGYEGSHDWDLVLRLTERTKEIHHISKILYHGRTISALPLWSPNAEEYAQQAAVWALQEALQRRGEFGWVEPAPGIRGRFLVRYAPVGEPKVSIIVLTRDRTDLLAPCLQSIFDRTTYGNYEVLVVDNGSVEAETFELLEYWKAREPERLRVIRIDIPFNWSILNNEAVKHTQGELLVLLNNDTEVITPNWLEEMAGQAIRPSVGTVGVKLLYHDHTIQHAGIVFGDGGLSRHLYHELPRHDTGYFDQLASAYNCAAVTGACLMVKKKLYEEAGGANESIAVAYNDVDFGLRLLDRGLYHVLLPHVELVHHECKTRGYDDTPEKLARSRREELILLSRWKRYLQNDPFFNVNRRRQVDERIWLDEPVLAPPPAPAPDPIPAKPIHGRRRGKRRLVQFRVKKKNKIKARRVRRFKLKRVGKARARPAARKRTNMAKARRRRA